MNNILKIKDNKTDPKGSALPFKFGECGGIIKPDVVLYGENLNDDVMNRAAKAINEAQVLIVGGTSLSVWPAASLIDYFRGNHLIVINKTQAERDSFADLVIREPIGEVFSQIVAKK